MNLIFLNILLQNNVNSYRGEHVTLAEGGINLRIQK